jgi:hypothetical protein
MAPLTVSAPLPCSTIGQDKDKLMDNLLSTRRTLVTQHR